MDDKTIKSLLIIFAGLLVIAISFNYLDKFSLKKEASVKADFNLSNFTKETVEKVRIKKGDDEKTLVNKDGLWKINDEIASSDKINTFFNNLKKVEIKEVVSKNPENHKNFGINEDDAYLLIFTQNGKNAVFFIGNPGISSNLFYLKKKGSKNIYLASGLLRNIISQDTSEWLKESSEKNEDKTGS